jgi:hypothetical protein
LTFPEPGGRIEHDAVAIGETGKDFDAIAVDRAGCHEPEHGATASDHEDAFHLTELGNGASGGEESADRCAWHLDAGELT